jgi:signal transduction histidine kinase
MAILSRQDSPKLWHPLHWEEMIGPKNPDGTARKIRHRPRFFLVLCLGFGGLLTFILAAGAGTLYILKGVRSEEGRIRQGFLERSRALDQIRGQIYLSGTYVRDFLLSPDAPGADAQRARLAGLEREAAAALDAYSRSLEPEEREHFRALRSEIEAYWRVLYGTAAWTPEQRSRLRYSFFYNELVPRRTTMLQIADRIAAINERGLNRAEERQELSAEHLRWSLLATFAITLIGGLALAMVTVVYTVRLERELQRRLDENGRSRSELEQLSDKLVRAQESERRTLARELHDEVGQSLSAIFMEAENAAAAQDPQEISGRIASIRGLAEKTVNVVRDLALLLRPSMLDDLGLVPALKWQAREMGKRTGQNIIVSADEQADHLPDEHKTCIYRVVQESMNNSARHAGARTVRVVVRNEPDRVLFTIQDDGIGFEPGVVRGLGLVGMEERVRRLGGKMQIDSQPGRGTTVAAELPLVDLAPGNGHHADSHFAG